MLSFGLLETRLYDQAEKAAMAVRVALRSRTLVLFGGGDAHSRDDSRGPTPAPPDWLLLAGPRSGSG